MENPFESLPRIFVVDDEPEIAKMMAVILQMNLFDAVPYTDPAEALAAAKAEPPQYVITDIMMPGMNGVELAIQLQQEVPACKVLLFTGQAGSSDMIRKAQEAGNTFVLVQKPIHPTKLVEAIRGL